MPVDPNYLTYLRGAPASSGASRSTRPPSMSTLRSVGGGGRVDYSQDYNYIQLQNQLQQLASKPKPFNSEAEFNRKIEDLSTSIQRASDSISQLQEKMDDYELNPQYVALKNQEQTPEVQAQMDQIRLNHINSINQQISNARTQITQAQNQQIAFRRAREDQLAVEAEMSKVVSEQKKIESEYRNRPVRQGVIPGAERFTQAEDEMRASAGAGLQSLREQEAQRQELRKQSIEAQRSPYMAASIRGGQQSLVIPGQQQQTYPGYRPFEEVMTSAASPLSTAIQEYISPQTQQERTLQQAGVLLGTSGIESAQQRYNQLQQTLNNMPYSARLNNQAMVRNIQSEMEKLQKQINEGFGRAADYIRGQTNVERWIEERRRMIESGLGYGEGAAGAGQNQRDLQSMATRGFYQTPYAFQNA